MRVTDLMRRIREPLKENDELEKAEQLLRSEGIDALPVVNEKGAVVGVVSAKDLPRLAVGRIAAANLEELTVDEVMSRKVVAIEPDATLQEAAGAMLEGDFRHLPVVDEDLKLVGIIAERDLREWLGTELHDWPTAARNLDEPVSSAMTANPTALSSGARLVDALAVFADDRLGAMPVLDERERLVGILSYVDVLEWLRRRAEAVGEQAPAPT